MDNRFLWHAGSRPVNQRWPLVPALRGDELFSSWLIRCSLCHACDPLEIAHLLWPTQRVWTRDCDLTVYPLSDLSRNSGIPEENLHDSTLQPVCERLGLQVPSGSVTPWILSLGGRNLRRAGGLQYCPACFSEPRPFYRMQWRLAWYTSCPVHGVLLRDRCPHCQAIVSPHRLDYRAGDLTRCHVCHGLLMDAEFEPADAGAEELEAFADSVVRGNVCGFGGLMMGADEWFALMKGLHRLMRALAIKRTGPARAFLQLLDVDIDAFPKVSLGLTLECLTPRDRVCYLSAVNAILKAGASRFAEAAEATHLCHSSCRAAIGADLSCLSKLLPQTPPRPYVRAESGRSLPRSKQSVLRAWLRFQRKALRAGVRRVCR
ncbi:TniQ [compost metagenome]